MCCIQLKIILSLVVQFSISFVFETKEFNFYLNLIFNYMYNMCRYLTILLTIIVQDLLCSFCMHCVPIMILNYIVFLERGETPIYKKARVWLCLSYLYGVKKWVCYLLKVPAEALAIPFRIFS